MTQAEERAIYDGYNRIKEPMRKRIFYEDYSVAKTFLWSMASCLNGGSNNLGELTISSAISLYVDIHILKHEAYMTPQKLKGSINGKYATLRQINEKNFDDAVEMALEYIYSHEPDIREKENTMNGSKGLMFEQNPDPNLLRKQDVRMMGSSMPEAGKNKGKKILIVSIIAALLVIGLIVGIIIAFNFGKKDSNSKTSEPVSKSTDDDKDKKDEKDENTEDNNDESVEERNQDPVININKSIKGYKLEEVSNFEKADNMYLQRGLLTIPSGDGVQIIKKDGNILNDTYYGLDDIGDGYYSVKNSKEEVNSVGLITSDGEELIACEAAIIKRLNNKTGRESGRYLEVIYSTGEADNEDEAFFYMTDSPISLSPDEDDKLYTGYGKIYDTKERRFVGDIKDTTSSRYSVCECGECITMESESGELYLYDSDGRVVMQFPKYSEVGNGYIIVSDAGNYNVYDQNGIKTYQTENMLSEFNSDNGYMRMLETDKEGYKVIDINGNVILSDYYKSIFAEKNNIFEVETLDNKYQLVDAKGDILAESINNIYECDLDGYYYYEDLGSFTLVNTDGIIIQNIINDPAKLTVSDNGKGLIINDKEYSLDVGTDYLDDLVPGLARVRDKSNHKYGAFDMFTGTQLLEYEYDDIEFAGGYIYARKDNKWTVYNLVEMYD